MSFLKSNKALNTIASRLKKTTRYGDIADDAIRVGKNNPVNLSSTKKTAYAPGQSPGHKKYLEQWGEMPKETRASSGVSRATRRGRVDKYTE